MEKIKDSRNHIVVKIMEKGWAKGWDDSIDIYNINVKNGIFDYSSPIQWKVRRVNENLK